MGLKKAIIKSLKAKPAKWITLHNRPEISCHLWETDKILCAILDLLQKGTIEMREDKKLYVKEMA